VLEWAGIKLWGEQATGFVIEHNLSHDNKPATSINTGSGIQVVLGSGTIVRSNVVYNNNQGIWIDETSGTLVDYNVSYNNTQACLYLGNAVISANLVYNNTCYGNDYGIQVYSYTPTASGVVNNLIKNNLSLGSTMSQFYAYNGGENDGTNGSGNVYTYNGFGVATSNFLRWGASTYSTYALWEAATGNCGTTGCSHSMQADPLFTNAGAGDFTLQAGSPAIGAGVYIPGVSTANPPNIGAK
jgi:parallel beta-helix repeat protein